MKFSNLKSSSNPLNFYPKFFYPVHKLQISFKFIFDPGHKISWKYAHPLLPSTISNQNPQRKKFVMECNFENLLTISLWITCVKKTGLEVVESLFCFSLLPTLSKNNFGRLLLSRHSLLKAFMFLKNLYHSINGIYPYI